MLTNPYGFWALAGVPVIVLIHFLQRRAKVETISTLFLLRQTQRESTSGRRFDRLVNSVPLWLQIIAVLLATWLLVQPRYVKARSTQRIAIVLDSSASMQVAKEKLPAALKLEIPRLQGNAANVELWLMESDPNKPKIFQGTSIDDMLKSLEKWQPTSGSTDPSHTLRVARSLVGGEGAISYITDIPTESHLPFNASHIAIGETTDNCGFTGVSFTRDGENLIWRAMVRNYSDSAQTRTWHLVTEKAKSSPQSITIQAGRLTTLQGVFPADSPRCQIELAKDSFTLDDTLPLVRPAPKPLIVHSTLPKETSSISEKMISSFPNLKPSNKNIDLLITHSETTPVNNHLLVFSRDMAKTRPYLTGGIVVTKHPLMDGLNWQTLLVRANPSIPHDQSDQVLLWQGNRALIYLRQHPASGNKALIFNFDVLQSNALKQPATAVLLLRFCEQLRKEKVAPESRITETSEPLEITRRTGQEAKPLEFTSLAINGDVLEKSEPNPRALIAPETPGFFTIKQGETALLTAANYFADTREADFSECGTSEMPAGTLATAVNRHTREDHLWRIWVCLILAALLGAWYFTKGRATSKQ
ncbi:MAG: BatA domain-containing protein [Akkermansiaceae bacterium]